MFPNELSARLAFQHGRRRREPVGAGMEIGAGQLSIGLQVEDRKSGGPVAVGDGRHPGLT
jgi:hypothetical protein